MHRIYSNQMEKKKKERERKKSAVSKGDDGIMCIGMKGFGLSKVS